MREFDPPPNDGKTNRFDGPTLRRDGLDPEPDPEIRDVSIEAMLRRLDEALDAIASLESDGPPEAEVG